MVRLGYPKERCAGLLTVSGGLGPIIPPSIIMVVYCTITNSSVGDMFKGGIVAGLMISIVLVVICIYYSNKEKWPKNTGEDKRQPACKTFYPCTACPFSSVCYFGRYIFRAYDATESAAVAVIYSFIVSVFVYRELHPRDIYRILLASGKSSAMILFIIRNLHSISWLVYILGDIRTAGGWQLWP